MSKPILAHVMLCTGPACSDDRYRDGRAKPAIAARAVVDQWKAHKLYRFIHLTLTGCLGQCGRANQAAILTNRETIYLEQLSHQDDVSQLIAWGCACAAAENVLPLPDALARKRYARLADTCSAIT